MKKFTLGAIFGTCAFYALVLIVNTFKPKPKYELKQYSITIMYTEGGSDTTRKYYLLSTDTISYIPDFAIIDQNHNKIRIIK
jgi:hypothetical protein